MIAELLNSAIETLTEWQVDLLVIIDESELVDA